MSTSRASEAIDLISAAISIAIFLQLNLELDKSIDSRQKTYPYGLDREGFAESRRRTYWACFVLERLKGIFPVRLGSLIL